MFFRLPLTLNIFMVLRQNKRQQKLHKCFFHALCIFFHAVCVTFFFQHNGAHILWQLCPKYWHTCFPLHLLCVFRHFCTFLLKGKEAWLNMSHHAPKNVPTFLRNYWGKLSQLIDGVRLDKSV